MKKKPDPEKVVEALITEAASLMVTKPKPVPLLPPRPLTPLEKLQRDPDVRRVAEANRLYTISVTPKDTDRIAWVKGTLESILKAHVASNPKLPPLVVKHIRMALAPLKKTVASGGPDGLDSGHETAGPGAGVPVGGPRGLLDGRGKRHKQVVLVDQDD